MSQDIQVGKGATSLGDLFFLSDRDPRASPRPLVVVLHGTRRHSESTLGWLPVLSPRFDVVLVDLPGHGRSPPIGAPTLDSFTLAVQEFLDRHFSHRETVILGESIGGLVALGLGTGASRQIKGMIVADPPMTTSKLWPVFGNFNRPMLGPSPDFVRAFFASAFGYEGDRITGERMYYSRVARVRTPTVILTGDVPLFPVRNIPNDIPCLLDDVDKSFIGSMGLAHVSIETARGIGHLCLDPSHDEVRRVVLEFCGTHLSSSGRAKALGGVSDVRTVRR